MALLWIDGFRTYGDVNNTAPQPTGRVAATYVYVNQENQFDVQTADGLLSDACLELPASAYQGIITTPDITTNETVIAGLWFRRNSDFDASGDNDWPVLNFKNGTTTMLKLCVGKDSLFLTGINDEFLGGSGVKVPEQQWHHIEMKATARSNTTGNVEVRLNSCPIIKADSVKTSSTSNYYTRVSIGDTRSVESSGGSRFESFYVCDATGSVNNDFLGPSYAEVLFPNGDDTVNFATTGNTSNHFENVGYSDAMWTSDYIEDSTTGNRDIFTLEDVSYNYPTVHGVLGSVLCEGISSGQNYHIVVDSNGTETESSNLAAAVSTNATGQFIVELDPDTSNAWTPATLNAAKMGIELQ